jgi:hypothetical protein
MDFDLEMRAEPVQLQPHVEVEARVRMRQPTKQMMEFTREVVCRRELGWL